MAVTNVGTPGLVRSTTGVVTGAWNGAGSGDQPRTAGHLLVAVVTSSGTTSAAATAQNTGTSGWTKQAPEVWNSTTNAGHVLVAFWTKVAAGGDAAPSFTSTISGTAVMTCTLFELAGNTASSFIDRSTSFSSSGAGTASATITGITQTLGANPAKPDEFALVGVVRQRSAATATWTPGTGFTNATNDGGTSSTSHTATDFQASPPIGAHPSDAGTYGDTGTTSFAAGKMVIFNSAPLAATASGALSIAGTVAAKGAATTSGALSVVGSAAGKVPVSASGSFSISGSVTARKAKTVTATQSGATHNGLLIRVLVLPAASGLGARGSQTGVAAHEVTLTTTEVGSIVYSATENGNAGAVDAAASNTKIDGVLDSTNGQGYGTFKSAATVTPGSFTAGSPDSFNGSAAALEVLTSSTLAADASSPAAASTFAATAVTTALFGPPPGSPMVALVSSNGNFGGVVSMTVTDSDGLAWTEVIAGQGTSQEYAGIWVANMAVAATASGALSISGTVAAKGAATASGAFSITGSAAGKGKASPTGAMSVAGTVTAKGKATASGALSVVGTVAAKGKATAAGALSIAGSAAAKGSPSPHGALSVSGSTAAVSKATATGVANISGSVSAKGRATASGALSVSGSTAGKAPVTASGSLAVAGVVAAKGEASPAGTMSVSGSAAAHGPGANASGSVSISGTVSGKAAASTHGSLNVAGTVALKARMAASGSLAVTGSVVARGSISSQGAITITGEVMVAQPVSGFAGALDISGGFAVTPAVVPGQARAGAGTSPAARGGTATAPTAGSTVGAGRPSVVVGESQAPQAGFSVLRVPTAH